jgi:uracil-DNA glycosylase family 4
MQDETQSDFTARPSDSAKGLVTKIQQVLRTERELFGNILLVEKPSKKAETGMAPKKEVPPDQETLFELPTPAKAPITMEPWGNAPTLEALDAQISSCVKCSLGLTRTRFVFGVGDPHATLMLIGEAPGADEDAQGEPFVGRAGQLLNKILAAIHFRREDVYICNILKCRPPGNRTPQAEEVEQCLPYLRKQIQLVKPKLIVCLGLVAAEELLHTRESLTTLRGKTLAYDGIPVKITYHPAALLRNPNWKRPAWEDVQVIRTLHDQLVAGEK